MKLKQRTILITGGSSGIGFALAQQLLVRGNTVIVTGRDPARLDATRDRLPGVHTLCSDVSEVAAIATLAATVRERFPALDTLINNAGIMRNLNLQQPRELTDLTRELDINLAGPMRMVQQFLPQLRQQREALIVNVSSGLAFVPLPLAPVYCASKAALHSYTQSLRVQLRGTRVTVVELAPPAVETPLLRAEFAREMADQTGMDVAQLARRAIAGIERGQHEIRPGLSNVLRLMSRIAPGLMLRQMTKMGAGDTP